MKKLGTVIILFSLCTSSWGSFYVGVGAGPDTANFSKHAIIKNPEVRVLDNESLAGKGLFFTFFGGYAWNYKRFYLAGEVNLNASSLEYNSANIEMNHHTISHTSYQIKNNYGFSFLPGFLFSNTTLFYARAGFTRGHFIINTTDSSLDHVSQMLSGYRYGLGVEQTVYPHVGVRLEWSQINYDSKKVDKLTGLTRKISTITPRTDQFEFGIDYRFC